MVPLAGMRDVAQAKQQGSWPALIEACLSAFPDVLPNFFIAASFLHVDHLRRSIVYMIEIRDSRREADANIEARAEFEHKKKAHEEAGGSFERPAQGALDVKEEEQEGEQKSDDDGHDERRSRGGYGVVASCRRTIWSKHRRPSNDPNLAFGFSVA